MIPSDIINLKECFKKIPGIGEKSAERMALQCLNLDQDIIDLFSVSLSNLKDIKHCSICHNITNENICLLCSDESRNSNVLCVVEDYKNVFQIEKLGLFKGKYHVLGGLISPLDDINPDDLNIKNLIERVENEKIKEIILVVKPSIEGETTTLYISKLLNNSDVTISKIAHGIPIGADIDYVDSLTLELALDERINIPKE